MEITEAKKIVGVNRIVWIDDCFSNSPQQLAELLVHSSETASKIDFPELQDAFEQLAVDPDGGLEAIQQALSDLTPERIDEIRSAFFSAESEGGDFVTDDLDPSSVQEICNQLGISLEDRWTFENAEQKVAALCEKGDTDVGYIVDLNEAGGKPTRGLEILDSLFDSNSTGIAFILTHETDVAGEGSKEKELRTELSDRGGLGIPVSVIAKARFFDQATNPESLRESIKVCLKRAGLRRSLHQVLVEAKRINSETFDVAANKLSRIAPEQLESFVFDRGYREGVSELHVVERAITAYIGRETRRFFGTNEQVHASTERLRALKRIELERSTDELDLDLADFREAEVWESDELLNWAYTPISCGDVFEFDMNEFPTKVTQKKFVLLGQPCDISLRPKGQSRAQNTAFLIPLREHEGQVESSLKSYVLPFSLNGRKLSCEYREATTVRLKILDLASFRRDGVVRVDHNQTVPDELLPGQKRVYEDRVGEAKKLLEASEENREKISGSPKLALTFETENPFKKIFRPRFLDENTRPKRVTWSLRRSGRFRMPFAAVLMENYSDVMSRRAFDIDYVEKINDSVD